MIWTPVKGQEKYAIESGEWTICKTFCKTEAKYTLWRGDKSMGLFGTAEEAKEKARD
jgi:hypothetical protein